MATDASPAPRAPEPRSTAGTKAAIILLAAIAVGAASYLANRTIRHIEQLSTQIDLLTDAVQQGTEDAEAERQRALAAERSARAAAASRESAQTDADVARMEAADAIRRATDAEYTSQQAEAEARQAREEAAEIRRLAEAEMNRLTEALGRIADTRRTALGLVMSLDEGYLKFDFDRAELRLASREVLSRIAGILYTTDDFAITVSGHTDARGTELYNKRLSERRAQAVADYLIEAGLTRDLFSVEGLGKSQLIDPGTTEEAHARNRRVELGIVNSRMVEIPPPLPPG